MDEKKNTYNVIGLGEILWDLLPEGKQLGGAPANFAYHAQVLGGSSFIISAIGDDPLGDEILDQLHRIELNHELIAIDKKHPTGTVSVELDENGVPDFTIHENVAWDFIPFSPAMKGLAAKTDAVCFGSLAQRSEVSRKTMVTFLTATPAQCLRVFDVNLRQSFYSKERLLESLQLANVLKLNDDELPVVADLIQMRGSELEILRGLLSHFQLKMIALTKGSEGSRLVTPEAQIYLKAPSVQVVDTVGAGDAFTAALVVGLLKDNPLEMIHKNATMLAAYVCTQKGATPRLTEELKTELQS